MAPKSSLRSFEMNRVNNGTVDNLKGPVSVWVDTLSLTALPGLMATFLRHGRFTLHFTGATRDGLAVAWLLYHFKMLVSRAIHTHRNLQGELRDDPNSAAYRMYAAVNEFSDRLFETYSRPIERFTYPNTKVRPDRVLTNLRKAAAQTTYELLGLLELARYQHQIEGLTPRRVVIMSSAAVLANQSHPGWAGEEVEFICPWNQHESLSLRLGRGVLQFMMESLRRRRPARGSPASVGVEAVWRLDPVEKLDALFWWWDSKIPPDRVILLFQRPRQPASYELVAKAEQLGIQCAVLNPRAVGDSPHLLWRPAPGLTVSVRRLWRNWKAVWWGIRHGTVGRWVACRAMDMLHHSEREADFLEEFNVRAILDHQDAGMDYLSLACDVSGAARIGFHWSHLPWPIAYQSRLHQVYFAWGSQHVAVMEAAESCVDHILLSGCIVKGAYPGSGDGRSGQSHRSLVTEHGASRVLALFDTSIGCERFYEFFLRRMIEDPHWGLLIKPKRTPSGTVPWLNQDLPELKGLYEEALATGRTTLLDWRMSPAEAAEAADFSVGIDINSAVVVAALAGHRAIHLDYVHLPDSPFSEWASIHRVGADRLVFNDPEKLWEKLNRYFDEPEGEPNLGLMDNVLLEEIDPFQDGRAGERIGDYIRWCLGASDNHLDRDEALEFATQRYAEKWGEKSVVKGLAGNQDSELVANVPSNIQA